MSDDELVKRLAEAVSRDIGRVQADIGGIKSEMVHLRRDFERMAHELDAADVKVQKVRLDSVAERLKSIEDVKNKVIWLVISSVILAVLSVVFGAALRG